MVEGESPEARTAALSSKYGGRLVRVFLSTGAILKGRASFDEGWVHVVDERTRKKSSCNLDHIVSIAALG